MSATTRKRNLPHKQTAKNPKRHPAFQYKGYKSYLSYNFIDKDPIIDEVRTIIADEGISFAQVERASGVTSATLRNWFYGQTKRPCSATVEAVLRGMGYERQIVKAGVTHIKSRRRR